MDSTSSHTVYGVKSIHYNLTERRGRVKTELPQIPVRNTVDILGVNWASAFFNFIPKRTKEDLGKKNIFFAVCY